MRTIWLLHFFLVLSYFAGAQNAVLSGKVTDTNGGPIPGVNVFVSTSIGTATKPDGTYQLAVSPGSYKLTFSAIGFQQKQKALTVKSGEKKVINVTLTPSSQKLEQVVVTASKRQQRVEEVPVSMEILPPRIIESKNTYNLETVMEQVPSVSVLDGQASIRGGGGFSYGAGSRVLVLLDGMPLLSGDANDVKWNYLPVENIEQIEVVKGASSALFGSSALNGVINIRTKKPSAEPQTTITLFQGIYDDPVRPDSLGNRRDSTGNLYKPLKWWNGANPIYSGLQASHMQRIGKWDVGAQFNAFNDQGYRQGETEQRFRGNFQLAYRPNNQWHFSLNGGGMSSKGGLFFLWESDTTAFIPRGGLDTATTTISYYNSYRAHLDPQITFYAQNGDKHLLRGRYFFTENNSLTQPSAQSGNWFTEYQYLHTYGDNKALTAGMMYSHTVVLSQLYGDHVAENIAPYLQWDHKWGKLSLSLGARGEYFRIDTSETRADWSVPTGISYSDSSTTWKDTLTLARNLPIKPVLRMGLNYELTHSTFLRASFGQGYRFPSIAERHVNTSISILSIFPNPELQPETGYNLEVGAKQLFQLSSWKGYADVAWFFTEYQNMAEFTFGFYLPDSIQNPTIGQVLNYTGFKSLNVGQARISGIDASIGGTGNLFGLKTSVLAGYTFMNPVSLNNDSAYRATFSDTAINPILKYRFRHLAKADVMVEPGSWMIGVSMRYNSFMENIDRSFVEPLIGTLEATRILPGLNTYREENQQGNLVADARVAYRFTPNSSLTLNINNLMNTEYMGRPGDIQPPRNFSVRYSVTF